MNFGRQRIQISVPRAPEGTDLSLSVQALFIFFGSECHSNVSHNFFSILQNLTYPLHSLLCFTVLRLNRKEEGFYKRKL